MPPSATNTGPGGQKELNPNKVKVKGEKMESTLKLKPSVGEQIDVLCAVASVSQVLAAVTRVATQRGAHVEGDELFMEFISRMVDGYKAAKILKI